jgi:hypothetical protein
VIVGDYNEIRGIQVGNELKLVCRSNYTYPPTMLTWYRDDKVISKSYETIESLKMSEAIYRISSVNASDDKAVFRCESFNQALDKPKSTQNLTLNVWYGPSNLKMTGEFEVKAGANLSAVCTIDASNPPPSNSSNGYTTIQFSLDGIDSEKANVINGSATFFYTLSNEHNNKELKCFVENKKANIKHMVTRQIKVLCNSIYYLFFILFFIFSDITLLT